MKRVVHLAGALALVAAAFAAASGTEDTAAVEEQVLICACATSHFPSEHTRIDPAYENNYDLTSMSYETLMGYDPEGVRKSPPEYSVVPWLAESIDSDDFITWAVNLRRGILFHSGNEMTAEDVKFSIERVARWQDYVNVETTGAQPVSRIVAPVIDRVEVVDDYTVRIHTRDGKPVPLMPKILALGHIAIMDKTTVLAHEQRGDAGFLWLTAGNSAGTGPYRVTEAVFGERVTYEKFDDYWGGLYTGEIFFDKLVYVGIQENGARRLAVEKGEVDLSSDLPSAMLADMMAVNPPGLAYYVSPAFQRWGLVMHAAGGPLADVRVREAIKYAIDYEGLVALHQGTVSIVQTIALAGVDGYDPELAYFYKRDVEKAQALLAEAGYGDGLEMDLWGHKEFLFGVDPPLVIEKLGSDLAEVGINVTLKAPTWTVMFESLFNKDAEAHSPALYFKAYGYQYADVDGPGGYSLLTDPGTVVETSGWNPTYLPDVDFAFQDRKLAESRATADPAERAAIFKELDRWYLKWGNHHMLLQVQGGTVYRDDLTGVYWNTFTNTFDWSSIRRQ